MTELDETAPPAPSTCCVLTVKAPNGGAAGEIMFSFRVKGARNLTEVMAQLVDPGFIIGERFYSHLEADGAVRRIRRTTETILSRDSVLQVAAHVDKLVDQDDAVIFDPAAV